MGIHTRSIHTYEKFEADDSDVNYTVTEIEVIDAFNYMEKAPSTMPGFPISVLANIEQATLCAALSVVDNHLASYPINNLPGKMAEARATFTSFNNMHAVADYLCAVDKLYRLLKDDLEPWEHPFEVVLPKEVVPLSLATYLCLAFADAYNVVPVYRRVEHVGQCEVSNPFSRAIDRVKIAYAATMQQDV